MAEENAKAGSGDWLITKQVPAAWIDGYADRPSVQAGDPLQLFTDTAAATWTARVFRLGWYGGAKGRLIWTSPAQPGVRQEAPMVDAATGLAEARWKQSLVITTRDDWPPGTYVIRLDTPGGGSHLVPFTIRDDDSTADVMVLNAVTTWQAYNAWGGCSLYSCPGNKTRKRATLVSFDRPYAHQFGDGSADLFDHELSLIALVESEGLDVTYATDIDLHEHPQLATNHRVIVSLGHDEYYSTPMRRALEAARDGGVNLMFLGANAVYRHIRLEPSWDGRVSRRVANYRSVVDPGATTNPKLATVEWRVAPLGEPEARLIGIQYACAGVDAPLRVAQAGHWIWAGTGVRDGQLLPSLVGNEADRMVPSSPPNLDLLARSPIVCGKQAAEHAMSYYSHPSGAGIFATGTIWWVCAIDAMCSVPQNAPIVRRVTLNVLQAFAAGPAGVVHPSGRS